ncbi:restriction endonuclease subunit S [Aliarcobacter cryaerophilus]|uniref:Restriction endonuclease subunit S n=2 Tax=unclassified Arcobacter TaxID=2593671 RepID=A0AA96DEA6_9BACT|nr:restriction endonuclease subunit S [Arcobacter sp. AZ-2023]WPD10147.1 restriction endonuclease subunit S [Arcobacter sp. DSM 115954]WNL14978.1 restriction endonuclease subunit S [Arcobacter sp. AZ-2023]WNL19139.1 restriction endonuclease subunit S [Arcobacter sp. AZ-2023]WNL21278.1 restriction endonuclease subunit S [Arcobacter sp. AZ-2023]
MSSWKECKLGELGNVITGKTPSSNNPEDWGFEMPFVTPSDYKNYGKYALSSERKLSNYGISRLRNKVLVENSIMVTCIGSDMGKVVMNKIPVITNQQINSIIPNLKIVDSDFLYYRLVSLYETLRVYGSDGTAVPIVNKTDFENIETEIPPLEEQKAIAEVLSGFDDKIDLLHRQNQTLESLVQTFFRQWFIEEAKEEWEEKPLSKIADFLNGLACQKFPPKNDIDKLPVLKIKDLKDGVSENSDYATSDVKPEYIVNNGDVIFAWSASLMVKIWDGEQCVLNQHLFKVTSKDFPKWFYYQWCKYHLDNFIDIASEHATTMGHIKRGDLDEAMCIIPSSEELVKMNEQISPIFEKLEINSKQIKSLEKMRDTLLQKLLSGEVRVEI